MKPRIWIERYFAGFLFAYLLHVTTSFSASSTTITGTLSSNTTALDQPVLLRFTIVGEHKVEPPKIVPVDGVQVSLAGTESNYSFTQGSATETIIFKYFVTPRASGTFTIPSITFTAGDHCIQSDPFMLIVLNKNANAKTKSTDRNVGFAELVLPSHSGTLNKPIPVELQFCFDAGVRFVSLPPKSLPKLQENGFKASQLTNIKTENQSRNGKAYIVTTFTGLITPTKIGKLTVGPAELRCQILEDIPVSNENFGKMLDDMAKNPNSFNSAPNPPPKVQRATIRSNQTIIEIAPAEGQP